MSPLYDYTCPKCGATQERIEAYDAPKPICTWCGKSEMQRVVSQTGPWKFGEGKNG